MTKRNRSLLPTVVVVALLLVVGCKKKPQTSSPGETEQPQSDYAASLKADVGSGQFSQLRWPNFTDYKAQVSAFYSARNWDAAWSHDGKPTRQTEELIRSFQHCEDRGLNPDDYDAPRWSQRITALHSKSNQAIADFDTAMTVNAMRFISDLHVGRINPKHYSFGVNIDQKKYDLPKFVAEQMIAAANVTSVLDTAEPQNDQYKALKAALPHYRELASQDNTESVPVVTGKSIEPGKPYTGSVRLQAKLKLYGDESADDPDTTDKTTYDRALVDAVKHFQHRQGLAEDGKLGKDTTAALNVPASDHLQQILDTMERWRWLPDMYLKPALLVNLPEFMLRGYEGDDEQPVFQMRVVVGQSNEEHRTPIIADRMRFLIFRPFWNVPVSIAKKEIAPHVVANAKYLAEKNYETVDRSGKPIASTAFKIEHGMVMVREKPGPGNSLGLVKFMFPNQFNVYLHSTPAVSLFGRTRRDYSHGCVRVQEPEKLATWLLRDNSHWDADSIHDAMETGQDNKTVMLSHPIPIVIFYGTAFIEDGEPHFFNDIYGYDKLLEKDLQHGPPYPQKPIIQQVEADV